METDELHEQLADEMDQSINPSDSDFTYEFQKQPYQFDESYIQIPAEVLRCVFKYLDVEQLCRVKLVSKLWRHVASHSSLYPTKIEITHDMVKSKFHKGIMRACGDTITQVTLCIHPNMADSLMIDTLTNFPNITHLFIKPYKRQSRNPIKESIFFDPSPVVFFEISHFQPVSEYCKRLTELKISGLSLFPTLNSLPFNSARYHSLKIIDITTSCDVLDYNFIALEGLHEIYLHLRNTCGRGNFIEKLCAKNKGTLSILKLEFDTEAAVHFNESEMKAIATLENLKTLSLIAPNNGLTDDTILHLSRLKQLERLCLGFVNNVTSFGFSNLVRMNFATYLRSLTFVRCTNVNNCVLDDIAINCDFLDTLIVYLSPTSASVGAFGLSALVKSKKLKNLKIINIQDSAMTIIDMVPLLMPMLRNLHITFLNEINNTILTILDYSKFLIRNYNVEVEGKTIKVAKRELTF